MLSTAVEPRPGGRGSVANPQPEPNSNFTTSYFVRVRNAYMISYSMILQTTIIYHTYARTAYPVGSLPFFFLTDKRINVLATPQTGIYLRSVSCGQRSVAFEPTPSLHPLRSPNLSHSLYFVSPPLLLSL